MQKRENLIIPSSVRSGQRLCDRRPLSLLGNGGCHNAALVPEGRGAGCCQTASSPAAPGAVWAITKTAECAL